MTAKPQSFDYVSRIHIFCQQKRIPLLDLLKELPARSANPKRYEVELQFQYEGLQVYARGNGPNKKEARSDACRKGLVQVVHHLKQSNSVLDERDYGLTTDEVVAYGKQLANRQNMSNGKAPINQWTPPSPAISPNRRDGYQSDGKMPSGRPAGYRAKPPTNSFQKATPSSNGFQRTMPPTNGFQGAKPPSNGFQRTMPPSNGFQGAKPPTNGFQGAKLPSNGFQRPSTAPATGRTEASVTPDSSKAKIDHRPSSTNSIAGQTLAKTGEKENKPVQKSKFDGLDLNEMAIEMKKLKDQQSNVDQNGSDRQALMNALVYLKRNKAAFQEIDELQKDSRMSYTRLMMRLQRLMPKTAYKFQLSDQGDIGVAQLFYEDLCLHTVFWASESTRPETAASFEEGCAKRMYFTLKLSYLMPQN